MPLCFQQLKRECASCGKAFCLWSPKIQHVSPSHNEECFTSGANNIEKTLSNEMYGLCQEITRILKRNGRFHSVLEQMIDLTQNKNISYRSNVPGLTLKVQMPPPDYFTQVNRDEFDVNDVLLVD